MHMCTQALKSGRVRYSISYHFLMNDSIFLQYKQTSDRRQQKPKAAVKEKSVTVRESKRDLALARQGLPGTKSNLRDIGGLLVPG